MTNIHETIGMMYKYGGNFITKLADLYLAADPENRKRIEKAFHHEFLRYEQFTREIKEQK